MYEYTVNELSANALNKYKKTEKNYIPRLRSNTVIAVVTCNAVIVYFF